MSCSFCCFCLFVCFHSGVTDVCLHNGFMVTFWYSVLLARTQGKQMLDCWRKPGEDKIRNLPQSLRGDTFVASQYWLYLVSGEAEATADGSLWCDSEPTEGGQSSRLRRSRCVFAGDVERRWGNLADSQSGEGERMGDGCGEHSWSSCREAVACRQPPRCLLELRS